MIKEKKTKKRKKKREKNKREKTGGIKQFTWAGGPAARKPRSLL
jgi:hypothetical protein